MNSRELTYDMAMRRVDVHFDITYEELVRALEGWELVLQEGILMGMAQTLTAPEYANQVCQLAAVMQQVRSALLQPPVPDPEAVPE